MIDIRPDQLEIIRKVLAAHVPEAEVRAFGSRVTGTAKDYSDLDLAIVAPDKLPLRTMSRIRDDFQESDLPFRVEVLDWHEISQEFRNIIEKKYEVVQEGKGS